MNIETLKALTDKVLERNNLCNNKCNKLENSVQQDPPKKATLLHEKMEGEPYHEQALDDAHKAGGKCKCSCSYWKGGGGWWSGYCTRREIKVSHGVTWCPAAEALTGSMGFAHGEGKSTA